MKPGLTEAQEKRLAKALADIEKFTDYPWKTVEFMEAKRRKG